MAWARRKGHTKVMQALPPRSRRFTPIVGFATCSLLACCCLFSTGKRYDVAATQLLLRASDVDGIRQALAAGANPNALIDTPRALSETLSLSLRSLSFYNPEDADTARRRLRDQTPGLLSRKVSLNDPEQVRLLLAAGADPNQGGLSAATPLHIAVAQFVGSAEEDRTRRLEIINLLIGAGADVNATDADGRTPLMMAAFTRADHEVVRQLLAAGADPTRKMRTGATASDLLAPPADPEVVKLLTSARKHD